MSDIEYTSRLRTTMKRMLGIPDERVELNAQLRGRIESEQIVVEKWIWTSEPGSRVPCVLYRPRTIECPLPVIVITCVHGGSKSQPHFTYLGQLYAQLGLVCLVLDPIGEEERHINGRMGTRAHDPEPVSTRADRAGRLIMGKLVFDTMRGIDFLVSREDVDASRIGVAGYSLGGAKAQWVAALDERIRLALICGWYFEDNLTRYGKFCTRLPNERMRGQCSWLEFLGMMRCNRFTVVRFLSWKCTVEGVHNHPAA